MNTRYAQENIPNKIATAEEDIPLLEEVVLPLKVSRPARKKRPKTRNATKRTSPSTKTAVDVDAVDVDKVKGRIKINTARMIDSLVEEYSTEITRRLRTELTSILDNLENRQP